MVKVKTKPRSKKHARDEFSFRQFGTPGIALGAVTACAIGAAVAYALMPRKKHTFVDTIEDYTSDAMEKGREAYNYAKDSTSDLYDSACEFFSGDGYSKGNIALGLIAAGILGASAIYMMNKSSSTNWNTDKWTNIATQIVDTFSEKFQSGKGRSGHHNPIQQAIDWASVGLNIWNEIKKGR